MIQLLAGTTSCSLVMLGSEYPFTCCSELTLAAHFQICHEVGLYSLCCRNSLCHWWWRNVAVDECHLWTFRGGVQ